MADNPVEFAAGACGKNWPIATDIAPQQNVRCWVQSDRDSRRGASSEQPWAQGGACCSEKSTQLATRPLFLEKMLEHYPKSLGDVPERHDGRISLVRLQPADVSTINAGSSANLSP